MDKKSFEKIVSAGDLILVTTKESGKYIDRFNKNILGTGIYRAESNEAFYLCGIAKLQDDSINTLDINQIRCYDIIKSVTVLKSAKDLKILAQKHRDER